MARAQPPLLLFVPPFVAISALAALLQLSYSAGLTADVAYLYARLALAAFSLLASLCGIVVTLVLWCSQRARGLRWHASLTGLLCLATFTVLACGADQRCYLVGFSRWAAVNIDRDAILKWRRTRPAKERGIVRDGLPAAILNLNPPCAYVAVGEEGEVHITWGGGFAHWGVCLRPEDTPSAPANGAAVPTLPGVYVWLGD